MEKITYRRWNAQGAYGRSYVEQHVEIDEVWESGTRGDPVYVGSQKQAKAVADALNAAYAAGRMESPR